MIRSIYKTEEGRQIVEDRYRAILAGYTAYPFDQLHLPTKCAQTHVLRFGDAAKPPLIMIHGSVSNSAAWLGCIQEFADHFCLYCLDIPGEPGLSEPARCELTSDEPHLWLDSVLDCLKLNAASFAAMSLGGWYALNYAIHRPERVTALSMITAGGLVPNKKSFIFKAILYMMLGESGKRKLNRAIYYKTTVPEAVHEFQAVTAQHFNPVLDALPVFRDGQLKKITAPIQFFGGDHDAFIDSVRTADRIMQLFPDADVHVLKDTGHVILDQFSRVSAFLQQSASSR